MNNKPGIKSTEFWIALAGMIGGLTLSVLPDNPFTQIVGAVLAAVCGPTYIAGRSWAKGKTDAAQANARTIADTILKKVPKPGWTV